MTSAFRRFPWALLGLVLLGGCTPQTPSELAIATTPDPAVGEYPLTVEFRAVHAGDGQTQYLWDFGDGNAEYGPVVTHTFRAPGTYTVYLYVLQGTSSRQASVQVKVTSRRPVASFVVMPFHVVQKNQPVTFDAAGSRDPDGQVVEYHWDFGDGESRVVRDPQVTHAFRETGEYTVTLTVVDDSGDVSVPFTRSVSVLPCCGGR